MSASPATIEKAIILSLNGHHKRAITCFDTLLKNRNTLSACDLMEAAFANDRGGKEHKAVPLYREALRGNLTDKQRLNVYFCLASSYRNIGRVKTARILLQKAISEYSNEPILKVLLAIIDHDNGKSGLAVSRLISVCLEHIQNETHTSYARFLKREAWKAVRSK